jgi:DNA polymerase-1
MSVKKQRLVLLDTHAIIHRAYHALPDFSNKAGQPTGALYGLITMILRIADDFSPDYIVAAYDLPGKTFRHVAYEDYKQQRKPTDNELVTQINRSRDILEALGVPLYEHEGFEADDILGTIVEQILDKKDFKDIEIIIASGDMDTLQLVSGDRVKVFTLRRGIKDTVLYNEESVKERFLFGPEQIPDYKALRGDPSDNIIGVKGIGEKGATELITKYGTIENIYQQLKTDTAAMEACGIKKRTITLLTDNEEEAHFSKVLATIRRDVPIDFSLPENHWLEGANAQQLGELCSEFEFRTLWVRLQKFFNITDDTKDEVEETVDESELHKLGIATWLLNSEMSQPNLDEIKRYTGTKSFAAAKKAVMAELKEKNLEQVYLEIELPIIDAVAKMTQRGIVLDLEYLRKLSKDYHTQLNVLEGKIYKLAGQEFNIKSPKQLGEILFEVMQLPTKGIKKTSTGGYSTKESELEKLKGESEIIELILQYIPIRSDLGIKIRNAFVAPKGYKLVALDYSQIELRVAAIMSGDPYLTTVFVEGKDIHAAVAAKVFEVAEADVTREMRSKAKVINFGILYGMGVTALSKNLESSRKEAQEFYNKYFEQFSSIEDYLERTKEFAYQHGYTETLFGRRRYFPALKSKLPFIRAAAERTAINAPIQGTATADIIKLAIKHVDQRFRGTPLSDKVHLVLQIHDELVFEIAEDVVDDVVPVIKEIMETVLQNSFLHYQTEVPLVVNYGVGDNWGELK